MPLIKSRSKAAVSRNIGQLNKDGYKPRQAIAIALDIQRRAKRGKADGGPVDAVTGAGEPSPYAHGKFGRIADAVVGGLRNWIEKPGRAMREGITTEEAANWAAPTAFGMMGVGAPNAMTGAAGIFGGKLAAGADKAALARAEAMAAKGSPRDQIWNETGWFKGTDDKWRFEIPDDSLSVRKGYGAGIEFGAGETWGKGNSPKIEHPDLTAAYPGKFDYLAHDVTIKRGQEPGGRFMPNGAGRNEEFYYSDRPVLPTLFVEAPTTKQARSIASHELQHGVQEVESFASGASPDAFYLDHTFPKFKEAADLAASRGLNWDSLGKEARRVLTDEVLMDRYRRTIGEVEARNVQARLDMTPEQRRSTPPWRTQDVPDAEQIVPPRGGVWGGMSRGGKIVSPALNAARRVMHKAAGGGIDMPFAARAGAKALERSGMVRSPSAGRMDSVPASVKSASYVMPADVVSGIGQGNSNAGANALNRMFKSAPGGAAMPHPRAAPGGMKMPTGGMMRGRRGFAEGGEIDTPDTDVMLSGGEFVLSPEEVAEIGGGDIDHGHEILDAFVKEIRAKTIKTLKRLPGPKKN